MKTIIITVIIFATQFATSQSYDHIAYKQDFDQVYITALDSGNYKQALKEWKQIAQKYPSLHTEELILQAYCYYKLGDTNKAAESVRRAWFHKIDDPAYLEQLKPLQWHPMVQSFSDKQKKTVEEGYAFNIRMNSLDYDSLSILIEQLNNSDLSFRAATSTPYFLLNPDTSKMRILNQDSLNMVEFIRIYDKYGYPGEKVSALFSTHVLQFLVNTADNEWFYTRMYGKFEQDVRNGSMPATQFLMWVDRHSIANGQKPTFSMYVDPDFTVAQKKITQIKENRLKFGVSELFPVPFELNP